MKELNYIFTDNGTPISLNLYDAERYINAVVIQPQIGNLVVYSNKGRYSPLLAKEWSVDGNGNWTFLLRDGFQCDNGEEITPVSFKKSMELSVKFMAKTDNVPIFSKLVGYKEFIEGYAESIAGIETENNLLRFRFTEPTRSGVIQSLSFAPFGYICSENRNSDGSWKNNQKFISSGPYRIVQHRPHQKHVLELRQNWTEANTNSPKRINFYFSVDAIENPSLPTIVDSFTPVNRLPKHLEKYKLVPEFINPIILGPASAGKFFSKKENRLVFKKAIEIEKAKLPAEIENHTKSDFYYPNQPPKIQVHDDISDFEFVKPKYPLIIQGKLPQKGDRKYMNWVVLEGALKSLNIDYTFDNSAQTHQERVSERYDIRFMGSAIGGGAQAWGVAFQFCSEIGPKFPDPSGSICAAVEDFEKGKVSEEAFSEKFNQRVFDDAAVIPLTHYGVILYLSRDINTDSISPLVSVMRFDQLELE